MNGFCGSVILAPSEGRGGRAIVEDVKGEGRGLGFFRLQSEPPPLSRELQLP